MVILKTKSPFTTRFYNQFQQHTRKWQHIDENRCWSAELLQLPKDILIQHKSLAQSMTWEGADTYSSRSGILVIVEIRTAPINSNSERKLNQRFFCEFIKQSHRPKMAAPELDYRTELLLGCDS